MAFKRDDFDKFIQDLNKLKSDTDFHTNLLDEKINDIEILKEEAEKYKNRKIKYENILKTIKSKENDLAVFKNDSANALKEKSDKYDNLYNNFEEIILKTLSQIDDPNLADYFYKRMEEEFSISRPEMELKVRKYSDAEKETIGTSNQHKNSFKDLEPQIITGPVEGKIKVVDLSLDKPKIVELNQGYIVVITHVPIEIKGYSKKPQIKTSSGSRASFGQNI